MFNTKNNRVLAIAPHADDIEIGMGGTIARLIDEGYTVKIVNAIIPCEDINGVVSESFKFQRKKESIDSGKVLKAEVENLDLDPYSFYFSRELVKKFDLLIRRFDPGHIFMTWEHDSHQDHQVMAKVIYSATRKNDKSLYMYETMLPGGISSEAFRPQLFIDISNQIELKRKALLTYKSVFESHPDLIEAIIGRALFRGSQIGVKYAEAFEIVKNIIY